MIKNNLNLAINFCNAIKQLANKPENLDNLENYLSYHFSVWYENFANTPENLVAELQNFADMEA